MDPNAAPLDVLHKSRLLSVCIGIGLVSCLWLAFGAKYDGGLRMMFLLGAGLFLLYFFCLEVQTVEFFPTYISINYVLCKRRIERADIDFVSMESGSGRVSGAPIRYNYVQMRLRNGRKIRLGGFKEDNSNCLRKNQSVREYE